MGRILLVGEDRERARDIRAVLRQDRHEVTSTRSPERWLDIEQQVRPDVVVATVNEPRSMAATRHRPVRGFLPPLLFVHHDPDAREPELEERLVDQISSPFNVEELQARVDALIRLRLLILRAQPPDRSTEAPRPRGGVRGLLDRVGAILGTRVPRRPKPTTPYLEVVNRVAEWAERRDTFEPGHAERVASLAAMMAEVLRLPDSDASSLLRAAALHDIGKVALPADVLRERGPLREDQMRLIRTHPERGAALIRALGADDRAVADAVRYHHERVDGSGYYGKDHDNIPMSARILAVAEAYDAMTTSRVRHTVSGERALAVLEEGRGSIYDAECVDALVSALRPKPRVVPVSHFGFPPRPTRVHEAN